ncbi:MAG: hypothetical protein E4G93_04685 [Dehalococcoidia bacterium]|nr:MAG: hypothetical protein E4G93_04685 [Dehalococcoidia bacterium]
MTAHDEFADRIRRTDTMKELLRSLDEEPARLLLRICARYEQTGRPVADHNLQLTGYFGETMLRVLMIAGFIDLVAGGRGALYAYQPTSDGLQFYKRLREAGGL